MFRVAYILLTIAGILACPFTCMAKVGGLRASVEQRAGCSCCQHPQAPAGESGSGRSPPEPERREPERRGPAHPEGCNCICLCKGAVETTGVPKVDLGEQTAFAVWLDASLLTQAGAESLSFSSFGEALPPPQLGSGRMIRLALASLLL